MICSQQQWVHSRVSSQLVFQASLYQLYHTASMPTVHFTGLDKMAHWFVIGGLYPQFYDVYKPAIQQKSAPSVISYASLMYDRTICTATTKPSTTP